MQDLFKDLKTWSSLYIAGRRELAQLGVGFEALGLGVSVAIRKSPKTITSLEPKNGYVLSQLHFLWGIIAFPFPPFSFAFSLQLPLLLLLFLIVLTLG